MRDDVRPVLTVALICLALGGCSWPVSRSTKMQITETILLDHLDSIYAWHSGTATLDPVVRAMLFRRVILLSGTHEMKGVAARIRGTLRPPFVAIRTDTTELKTWIDTAYSASGTLLEKHNVRDRATGLPVYFMGVDSIRGTGPSKATANLVVYDQSVGDVTGSRWFLTKRDGQWRPDSSYSTWGS